MLEATAFLSNLSDPDVEWLVANSDRQEVPVGTVLIQRGQPVDHLYLIVSGSFDVTVALPHEHHVARLFAGELVGEMSFVDLHPPSATVTASADSHVLTIVKTGLNGKIEADPHFASRFYKGISLLLTGRLRAAFARQLDLGPDPALSCEMGTLAKRFDEFHRRLALKQRATGA